MYVYSHTLEFYMTSSLSIVSNTLTNFRLFIIYFLLKSLSFVDFILDLKKNLATTFPLCFRK